jgi:hypothetical protein
VNFQTLTSLCPGDSRAQNGLIIYLFIYLFGLAGWIVALFWNKVFVGQGGFKPIEILLPQLFFFLRFVYLLYVSTLWLSSDTPEEGVRSHYGWL